MPVQSTDPQSTLPLIGAAKGPNGVRSLDGGDWILPLISKAINDSHPGQRTKAARQMELDPSLMNRLLNADGHLSVRKLGLLPESFWLALIDELRAHFKIDNDADRLERALDGVNACLSVIGQIAR
jgi:hypothetical protein